MTWYLDTDHPIADKSFDHLYPLGTARDNTKSPGFNAKLFAMYPGQISVLDLGCAGGGFVESVIEDGHIAVGLEGSDYSLKLKRAAWATIPGSLFTCDISHLFILHTGDNTPHLFDVVTAWDSLEHIEMGDLDMVFDNIKYHSKPGALFLMTTTHHASMHQGVALHRTRRNGDWWSAKIESLGFKRSHETEEYFKDNWLRPNSEYSMAFTYQGEQYD